MKPFYNRINRKVLLQPGTALIACRLSRHRCCLNNLLFWICLSVWKN